VLSLAVSKRSLLTGSIDRSVREWDLKTFRELRTHYQAGLLCPRAPRRLNILLTLASSCAQPEFVAPIFSLAAGDGGAFFTGSYDLRAWRRDQCAQLLAREHMAPVFGLTAANGMVYSASGDGVVKAWQYVPTGETALEPVAEMRVANGPVQAVLLSDKLLLVACDSGMVQVWGAHQVPQAEQKLGPMARLQACCVLL